MYPCLLSIDCLAQAVLYAQNAKIRCLEYMNFNTQTQLDKK